MKKSGKSIQKILKLKNISGTELSKKSGIKTSDVNDILKDKREPTTKEFKEIGKALDVPVTYFLFDRIELKDVPENKKSAFKTIAPFVKKLMISLMKDGKKNSLKTNKKTK